MSEAEAGDDLWVAAGAYRPDDGAGQASGDREATFQLISGVALFGGFAGDENPVTFDLNDRDFVVNETILTGDLAGDDHADFGHNNENSHQVVTSSGTDETAVMDGFTVTGGLANAPKYYGGGVYNISGSPTLINCTISMNEASSGGGIYNLSGSLTLINCFVNSNWSSGPGSSSGGGGIWNETGTLRMVNCTLRGNQARNDGGGLYNDSSELTMIGCTFDGNSASDGGGLYNNSSDLNMSGCTFDDNSASDGNGGGIYLKNGTATMANCTFCGNEAIFGGGMYNRGASSPIITNCTFTRNVSTGKSQFIGGGGFLNITTSSPIMTNCTFIENQAHVGGGMNTYAGNPILIRCAFRGNSATAGGGGMYSFSDSSPLVTDSIFSGNTASQGGGMQNGSSSTTVANCTFSGNTAVFGGGVRNYIGVMPTLTNCIFWGNIDAGGSDESAQIHSGLPIVTHGFIQGLDVLTGGGNIGDDPVFVRNPDPGPDEVWGTEDDDYGDLRLTAGSPAIDTGDPIDTLEPGVSDLDGHARVLCGRVDMGAYEFGIGDFDCDSIVDLDDYASWAECQTGPGGGPYADGCEVLDFDYDLDVDFADFAGFQKAISETTP